MDTSAPWRAVEVPEGGSDGAGRTAEGPRLSGHHLLLAVAAAVIVASIAVVVFVESRQGGQVEVVPAAADGSGVPAASGPVLVVQVAGAVAHPGVYSLPVGSRVADAIRAAGGYAPDVDPRLAEAQLNLAAKLQDGQIVRVPRRGDAAAAGGAAQGSAAAGVLNLNTATAEQLDTLPGIGPVTAAKIIAAREQQPFRSVDDLVTRKIVSASTLAKFRGRVTVG